MVTLGDMQVLQTNSTKPTKRFLGGKTKQQFARRWNRTKYTYDGADRLTSILEHGNPATPLATYFYDDRSRRDKLELGNGLVIDYDYYEDSAIHKIQHIDLLGVSSPAVWEFGYNAANQVRSKSIPSLFAWLVPPIRLDEYSPDGLNRYDDVNGQTLSYDGNSSLTGDGVWTYAYDVENRLKTAVKTGVNASYEYDPLGRRAKKSGTGVATEEYLNDGVEEIADYDGSGNLLRRYVHGAGIDERLVMYSATDLDSKEYYHADHQGSTVAVSDNGGSVDQQSDIYTYSAWGEPGAEGLSGNPFRYVGRRLDAESGLYYYRARYYSPALGRFLQTDPIGYDDQMNLYAYVGNDPLNRHDPNGLESFFVHRPTTVVPGGRHAFILVTKTDASGNVSIRERYTYGAENESIPLGRMTRITDPTRGVNVTDDAVANVVVNQMNAPETSIVTDDFASVTKIDAPDDVVVNVANAVRGAEDYDLLAGPLGGDGVNSNTAPTFIAEKASEIAGTKFVVPTPEGAFMPGTSKRHTDQIEHDPLPYP